MSEENVEIVREFVEAWNRDEREPALAFLDPDVVWIPAREDPDPRPHRGRDGVRAFWAQWEELFDDLRVEADELVDAGSRIVNVLHVSGQGRGSGVDIDQRVYQLIEVRHGLIARVDEFYDRQEAFQAAGLQE